MLAPDDFQKYVDDIFTDDKEINPYFGDIALGSDTIGEHFNLFVEHSEKLRQSISNKNTQLFKT